MGTRSDIIVKTSDGKFKRIYCHWDGYPEHNGRILEEHYTDQLKCEALVELGDISVLDKSPFEPPKGHSFAEPVDGYCVAYHRDRGEEFFLITTDTLDEMMEQIKDSWTEYSYYWDGNNWYLLKFGGMDRIPDVLSKRAVENE